MSDIKAGDLVMIVRPKACCGNGQLGATFTAGNIFVGNCVCAQCGFERKALVALDASDDDWVPVSRLTKIDPPAEGDTLPTRANLDQPVTA